MYSRWCKMEQVLVQDWLKEFKTLPETSIPDFAAKLQTKPALESAIHKVLATSQNELLEPLCHQLCEFVRSGNTMLHRFTLQFLPALITCLLTARGSGNARRASGSLEALLLALYNLEICNKDRSKKSFAIPSLSTPSVYHEGGNMGTLEMQPALEGRESKRLAWHGPLYHQETFTAQNRFDVLTFLLLCYNASIACMPTSSYVALCSMCSRVCVSGFELQAQRWTEPRTRIALTADFMVLMLTGIFHSMYNGAWEPGMLALEDALYRARIELYPEPLLVGKAMKDIVKKKDPGGDGHVEQAGPTEMVRAFRRVSHGVVTTASIRRHRWQRGALELQAMDESLHAWERDEGFSSASSSFSQQVPGLMTKSLITQPNHRKGRLTSIRFSSGSEHGRTNWEGLSTEPNHHLSPLSAVKPCRRSPGRTASEPGKSSSVRSGNRPSPTRSATEPSRTSEYEQSFVSNQSQNRLGVRKSLPRTGASSLIRPSVVTFSHSLEQVSEGAAVASTFCHSFGSLHEDTLAASFRDGAAPASPRMGISAGPRGIKTQLPTFNVQLFTEV
uniref:hyccin-like isoform X2 n=1 Tax=Myxine glutinosa TaxID=7769 RepID=UPI00358F9195